jgi:DNA repair protein RadC
LGVLQVACYLSFATLTSIGDIHSHIYTAKLEKSLEGGTLFQYQVYLIMTNLKKFSKQDLPREKLEKYGPEKLSEAELLAILLRTGTKELNVIELAKKVLRKYEDKRVSEVSVEELKEIHGLGSAKACEIVACFELSRRVLKGKQVRVLLSPRDVWDRMEDLRGSKREHFVVFYLDAREQEIKREVVSIGSLNESLVHPREVFESAIRFNAASIIVSHNHPSGDFEPSQADVEITRKLRHAGKLLGIEVTDHVIVTKESFKSII